MKINQISAFNLLVLLKNFIIGSIALFSFIGLTILDLFLVCFRVKGWD